MEFEQIEGFMVLSLFLGYHALWRLKKRRIISHGGDNPAVIYHHNRPTQKFFAKLSRAMSIIIAALIVVYSAGVKKIFALYQIVFLDNDFVNSTGFILGLLGLLLCWGAQPEMGNL
jgi:hypothetical protein